MPNRLLHDRIKTSPTIDVLSLEAEVTFYRLLTVADDFGRFEADHRALYSRCFPLKIDRIALADFGRWYEELVKVGLVVEYEVGGRRYGHFPTWGKYQRLRAKRSKFPAPPGETPRARPAEPHASMPPEAGNGYQAGAKEILEYLNHATGRSFRPVAATLRLIEGRLRSGATSEQCRAVIDAKCREWRGDSKMGQYLRPETLFNATKFESYLAEAARPPDDEDDDA